MFENIELRRLLSANEEKTLKKYMRRHGPYANRTCVVTPLFRSGDVVRLIVSLRSRLWGHDPKDHMVELSYPTRGKPKNIISAVNTHTHLV